LSLGASVTGVRRSSLNLVAVCSGWGTTIAWLVLGGTPTGTTALGGTLVVAAGVLVVLTTSRTGDRNDVAADPVVPPTTPEVPLRVPG